GRPATSATHAPNILGAFFAPHLDNQVRRIPDDGEGNSTNHSTPLFVGSRWLLQAPQPRPSYQTYPPAHLFAPTPRGSNAFPKNYSQVDTLSLHPSTSSQSRGVQGIRHIPRGVPVESTNIVNIIGYVLTQYERLAALSYYRPSPNQVVKFRQLVSGRLQLPGAARWAMYLGAQISESLLDGVLPEKIEAYDRWIRRLEQELHSTSNRDLTNKRVQNRLVDELEVGFLKLRLGHDFHILQLIRKCAPTFLQIVFSDPTLWPEGRSLTAVSVAHVLASTRYELGHFILLDAFYAMAYAVPPTIEYDTSCPPFTTKSHPVEWMHGCAAEFHMALFEINARCALGYVAHDWQNIEQRILSWQPCVDNSASDAWQHIAQFTVQESWRQTLLAYLYMAVCGVGSDDSRVQSAVRQIFQLLGTIRRQDSVMTNVHFVVQYLIAGACTPSEKRRALVRSQLSIKPGNRVWLLSGVDFVPLLDHLWHGAAANGRAIRWSDYMASRQTALPIPI
ncbi:hypothetical protein BDV93DRAFT_521079, partial [Ceratobasidium sp. AG-I]